MVNSFDFLRVRRHILTDMNWILQTIKMKRRWKRWQKECVRPNLSTTYFSIIWRTQRVWRHSKLLKRLVFVDYYNSIILIMNLNLMSVFIAGNNRTAFQSEKPLQIQRLEALSDICQRPQPCDRTEHCSGSCGQHIKFGSFHNDRHG